MIDSSQILVLVGVPLIIVFVVLAVYALYINNRRKAWTSGAASAAPRPPVQPADDSSSSVTAEQIESIVRRRLLAYPELDGVLINFVTGPDGGIVIRVGGAEYASVNDIPDKRIRKVIIEAVQDFNE